MLSALVLVLVSLGLISLLLFAMSWVEERVLSPQALIVHAARSRQGAPEHVEQFVASQSERLLQGLAGTRVETPEPSVTTAA